MKRSFTAALLLAAAALAAPARADTGVSLGLRSAYGLPMGDAFNSQSLGGRVTAGMPVWLEVDYSFTKHIYAGAHVQYGYVFVNDCPNGACSGNNVRFGLDAGYRFLPDSLFSPWAGLGVGYEILNTNVQGSDLRLRGFELLNLQAGLDLQLSRAVRFGPFAAVSFARYSTSSAGGVSTDIHERATHGWAQFGLAAAYSF